MLDNTFCRKRVVINRLFICLHVLNHFCTMGSTTEPKQEMFGGSPQSVVSSNGVGEKDFLIFYTKRSVTPLLSKSNLVPV